MPVLDVKVPGPDEYDLPARSVPAVLADVLHELPDLSKVGQGMVYVGCLVTNASSDVVTLKDSLGRSFPVQAGQPADCDFDPGVTWLGLTPDSDITAGQVVLIPRIRRHRYGKQD